MKTAWDVIVIGSGFGGSVSALRLTEKGYRVAVLEQGRHIGREAMNAAQDSVRRFLWEPALGFDGYFSQNILRHLTVLGGVGVGGGSNVYAAVLLEPKDAFYADPEWAGLGLDWRRELAPHYKTASSMLGIEECPWYGTMDEYLRETARIMGAESTFGPTPLGIYFGKRDSTKTDPYFGGDGPVRTGCRMCGECLGGCRYQAKNSLDKNYLYLAERKGADIIPLHKVVQIAPFKSGGYEVECVNPLDKNEVYEPLRAKQVVLSAGVMGTLELLFKCREEHGTLPAVSSQLGRVVRTNSEAIVAIVSPDPDEDLTEGPAISTHFWANPWTHITQNRFPPAYEFFKWQTGPLVDGEHRRRRSLRTLWRYLRHPIASTFSWRVRDWYKRVSALTVMQNSDNQIRLEWSGRGLRSRLIAGNEAPSYLPEANEAARAFAKATGGRATNSLVESLLGTSVTAHILGGCQMGDSPETGVIDTSHQVFGYPGLYVVDGSAISANVGVNPSLTIAALAERAMSLVAEKSS